jgi:hypothetical protein
MGAKDFRNTKYRGLCNIKLNSEDDSEDEE